ncbi:MAG: hybrid sensor histidine kinase/response regulator [Gemmatimonadetes bacterium]|nr:hybrid sensor histidine kinase/response regulator [Gemmatimonadota bacterium]
MTLPFTTPPTSTVAAPPLDTSGRRARLRDCTLLVVDDERANVELLEALLESDGYRRVIGTTDPRTVPALMTQHAPDLVLLDLHMPHRHGLDVLADLVADTPVGEYRPVLVLTADATIETRDRALELGARDFLTKPFDAIEVLLRVENLLDTRMLHRDAQLARARAELAEVRAAMLATWSRLLAATLDPAGTLAQLPRLLAQRDVVACVVGASSGGPITWYEAHFDERGARAADALRIWAEALATPRTDGHVPIAAVAPSMGDLTVFSAPIATVAGVCGALVVAVRESRAPSAVDQRLVEELATRTGMALEHARLLAEAELATSERERLLAVVAHDLRNPLGAVAMYAEMLRSLQPDAVDDTPVAAYAQKALATIHTSTRAMQHLVEDLLDASTLRGGALRIARTPVALGAPLDDALAIMRPAAEAAGVRLIADVKDDPAQVVTVDAARTSQLLCNLVANAVQATPADGQVTVRWGLSTDGRALEGAVSDTGAGIPAEQLPHLFTAFWRGDRRARQGVGLGLWIARAIVEGHGGELDVATAPNAGSSFRFTLPLAPHARRRED